MHSIKMGSVALLLSVLVSIIPGCSNNMVEPEGPTQIRIGVILPFTGSSASSGLDSKSGIELAAFIINNSHEFKMPLAKASGLPGLNHAKIKIIFEDSRGDGKIAAAIVEKLIKKDKVAAIIGCYNSSVTAAASEIAEIFQVPFLNPDSTSPILIQRGLKWFFRTTPDDEMFVRNFFDFFSDLTREKKISLPRRLVLVYENRLWGTGVARAEKKLASKEGYEIIQDVPYDTNDTQFNPELSRIKDAMPATILQASYAKDAVLFMQGYKAYDINPTAILAMNAGFISPYFGQQLGEDAEFILSREVWAPDIQDINPLARKTNQMFSKKYSRDMTGNSARSFTGLIVMADAINRAGSLNAEKIRKALLETDMESRSIIMPWQGVRFDPETGQNTLGRGIIVQRRNGKYVTVWPFDLASHPIAWPLPPWPQRSSQ